jgi:hypothetical protein
MSHVHIITEKFHHLELYFAKDNNFFLFGCPFDRVFLFAIYQTFCDFLDIRGIFIGEILQTAKMAVLEGKPEAELLGMKGSNMRTRKSKRHKWLKSNARGTEL